MQRVLTWCLLAYVYAAMFLVPMTERQVILASDDGRLEAVLEDFPDSPKGRYWACVIERHDGGSTSWLKRFDSFEEARSWLKERFDKEL